MKPQTTFPNANRQKFRRDRGAIRRAQIIEAIPGHTINDDPLLNAAEAAAYLALTVNTLQKWRCQYPDRLHYVKVGTHRVRYRRSVLDDFLKQQTVTNGAGVKK